MDPTHPRYGEAISGRHIELPFETKAMQPVYDGLRVDMWRILCEVAKYDYDRDLGQFRNPKLIGYCARRLEGLAFVPDASVAC